MYKIKIKFFFFLKPNEIRLNTESDSSRTRCAKRVTPQKIQDHVSVTV